MKYLTKKPDMEFSEILGFDSWDDKGISLHLGGCASLKMQPERAGVMLCSS